MSSLASADNQDQEHLPVAAERFFADARLPHVEGRWSRHSSRSFKPHMHRCFSIGTVEQGEISYQVEQQQYRLRPGCLALINPETLHACNQEGTGPRSYSILYLQTGWCLTLQQSLWNTDGFVPVQQPLVADASLYDRFVATVETLFAAEPLLKKEQMLIELMTDVFRQTCQPGLPMQAPAPRIDQVKALLAAGLDQDLSLDQLSSSLGLNVSTLIRQFKEETGLTPHAYRMNCRINQARQLLRQGGDIGETALQCGFFDQSHFHRHFKAMTTVTPREYQVNFMQ